MPGPEQYAGREQCAAKRHAVYGTKPCPGRARQQNFAISCRQRQSRGAEIAQRRSELARSAFTAQRRPGSDEEYLQAGIDRHRHPRNRAVVFDRLGQAGNLGVPSKNPPTTAGQRAPDHRADGAPHRAAFADTGQQRAECVVIGEVFDRVQQQRRGRARDTCQQPDDDDRTTELNGAPRHQLNLYVSPRPGRTVGVGGEQAS